MDEPEDVKKKKKEPEEEAGEPLEGMEKAVNQGPQVSGAAQKGGLTREGNKVSRGTPSKPAPVILPEPPSLADASRAAAKKRADQAKALAESK